MRLTFRRLAGLSLLFNLPFVLFRVQSSAFDTDIHIFFADHYRRAWFNLWEPRWYLGFSMASYPPLVHQLIALISWPAGALIRFFSPAPEAYPGAFTWVAEEAGFVLVLMATLLLLPLTLRAFARLFVGPRTADLAALLAIFLPALSLTAWTFGQLPTLLATGVVLLALARGALFVLRGRGLHLLQAVALAAVAAAAHHGVFLLVPFAGVAVTWQVFTMLPANAGRERWRRWRAPILRLGVWAWASGVAVAVMLWPFLLWSRGQQMQAPIDHASRHNFLGDTLALWYFFWPMYGPLLLAVPFGIGLVLASRRAGGQRRWSRWLPLLALVMILFVLGLGGTTPLPQLLFGPGWAWLTYDRFASWAALLSLPFVGQALLWLWRRRARWARPVALAFLAALIASSIAAGWLAIFSHAQPPALDVGPLVEFLSQPERQPYRYFTLGFGDQMAKLAAISTNGTPDGDYHTARSLPELRSSGLGAIDGAVWNPQGAEAAQPLLAGAAQYGTRWAFVVHDAYLPILRDTGWTFLAAAGPVEIWEHPGVHPVPPLAPAVGGGWLAAAWWGGAPLAGLLLALAALAREYPWPAVSRDSVISILQWLRRAGWSLSVALLALWWMHVLRAGTTPGVYFTYDSVIVYASDLAAALTLAVWLLERELRGERLRFGPVAVGGAGLVLVAAAGLSTFTSGDPTVSAATTAHLLLAAGWYWMMVNDPPEAALAGRVLGLWLAGETLAVLVETALQNTLWLRGLYLPWPGPLTALTPGASVVQNAAGLRWLRAYGTLPHPNILGGFALVGLGAAIERYLTTGRRAWLVAGALGIVTLILTFSRASWLGAALMLGAGAGWAWCFARDRWKRYRASLLVFGVVGLAMVLPLLPLLAVRADFSDQAVSTETRSVQEREIFALAGLHMLASRPLLGIGAGTFVEELAGLVPPLTRLEPVHNVILLAATETGLLGGLAVLALVVAVAGRVWRRRRVAATAETVWALVLLGIFVTGLFDHYWWTALPAQLAVTTALGLWAASASQVPAHNQVALDTRGEALGRLQTHSHKVGADRGI